jgi:hypothetical protein
MAATRQDAFRELSYRLRRRTEHRGDRRVGEFHRSTNARTHVDGRRK